MIKAPESVATFLRGKRIGVAGVSRDRNQAANAVFRKLKASGYEVFPINPHASQVEGTMCYTDVASITGTLDGVRTAVSVVCGSIGPSARGACQRRLSPRVRRTASNASLAAAR
jgi:acyl-CoA synthetase (NDP forming)